MPGQDLTRVTIPSFFLEPRSLLERMADTQMHPDLLLGLADEPDPVARMRGVVRWYLSGWHYKTVGVKKPFNPIIGETFACFWKHSDGSRTQYFAEQVSHRPPISGIYFENRVHNIAASAHVWTKSQFSAPQTTKSILDGACVLHLTNRPGESYFITFPTYYAHNLLLGTLRMEVGDTGHVVCESTGLRADIEFTQKTMFGGSDRLNGLVGSIRRGTGPKGGEELFALSGHWDSKVYIAPSGSPGKKEVLLDIGVEKVSPKFVLPLEAQGPWESRRLWKWATHELTQRPTVSWSTVDREKAQLEEEQRLLPCHAHGHGKGGGAHDGEWDTKCFHKKTVRDPIAGEWGAVERARKRRGCAVGDVSQAGYQPAPLNQPSIAYDSSHATHTPLSASLFCSLPAGTDRDLYVYDGMPTAAYVPGEPETNMLALSRDLPDPRGGVKGAGEWHRPPPGGAAGWARVVDSLVRVAVFLLHRARLSPKNSVCLSTALPRPLQARCPRSWRQRRASHYPAGASRSLRSSDE